MMMMMIVYTGQVPATRSALQVPSSAAASQRTAAAERKKQPNYEASSDADDRSRRAWRLPDREYIQRFIHTQVTQPL